MRLDIYRRPEHAGRFSYLAVPEGKTIPEEAISTDWEQAERGIPLDDDDTLHAQFAIDAAFEQINAKGYAITSVRNLENGGMIE